MQKKNLLFVIIALAIFMMPNIHTNAVYGDSPTLDIQTNIIDNITLDNACDISINMDNLYILDKTSTSGALITVSLTDYTTTNTNFYDTDSSIIIPGHLHANYSPNVIVSGENVTSIHSVSPTNHHITPLSNKYYTSNSSHISNTFDKIIDVCTTLNGDIFIMDSEGIIAKKAFDQDKFILYHDLSTNTIQPTATTQLCVSLDSNIVLLSHNNTIYQIAQSTLSPTTYQLPTNLTVSSLILDHYNQLYILSGSQLIRSTTSTYDSIALDNSLLNAHNFCIDYHQGTAYFITPTSLINATIQYQGSNFFRTLNDQSSSIDITTFTPSTPLNTLAPSADNIVLYQFPNYISKLCMLDADQTMTMLDDTDANFYYVLINNLNNTNTLGYVKKSNVTILPKSTHNTQYRLLLDNTPIYTLPTSININNAPRITCTLDKYTDGTYTILTPIPSAISPTDGHNITFIPVSFHYHGSVQFGYVDSHKIISTSSHDLPAQFVTNATTRQDITVYSNSTLDIQYQSLAKDTAVYVVQIDNDVCLIEWLENDTLKSGYVSHRYINNGTLSYTQIVGLIAMSLTLVVSIVLVLIVNKRRKRLQDVNEED